MALILRVMMFAAAPIAALFVGRDSLNFSIVQMMIVIILIVAALIGMALWPHRNKDNQL